MRIRYKRDWANGRIDPVLKRIVEESSINEENRMSWSDMSIDMFFSVIFESFERPVDLPSRELYSFIRKSIIELRVINRLNGRRLLIEVNKKARNFLELDPKKFIVITDLPLVFHYKRSGMRFQFGQTSLEITSKLPKYANCAYRKDVSRQPYGDAPSKSRSFLVARTLGRSENEGTERAFDAANLLCAVSNLAAKGWNWFGAEQRPQVVLYEGPYHYAFQGRKYTGTGWFNPDYRAEFWKAELRDEKTLRNHARSIRKALKILHDHPLRIPLSTTLLMMNEGMRSHELSQRTFYYWTAIERLFSEVDEKVPYDRIVKRAIFLEKDRKEAKILIKHLSELRNQRVHHGSSFDHQHQVLEYVADLVRRFVFYLIFNGDDLASHSEFLELADLPNTLEALKRREKAIERRRKFIETKRHRDPQ